MLNDSQLRLIKLTDSLNDIIEGCINGNRGSQEALYRMFSAKMFGVCMRYCRDYDDANDIMQEAFIKVFDKIHQYSNKGSFEGWVRRVVVNTALEKFRKRHIFIHLDDMPEIHEADNEDADFNISVNEMLALVQKLPDQYRLVFNLYVFEDMTHKEIAKHLEIAEGTSKSNLSRARAILQRTISLKTGMVAKTG